MFDASFFFLFSFDWANHLRCLWIGVVMFRETIHFRSSYVSSKQHLFVYFLFLKVNARERKRILSPYFSTFEMTKSIKSICLCIRNTSFSSWLPTLLLLSIFVSIHKFSDATFTLRRINKIWFVFHFIFYRMCCAYIVHSMSSSLSSFSSTLLSLKLNKRMTTDCEFKVVLQWLMYDVILYVHLFILTCVNVMGNQ